MDATVNIVIRQCKSILNWKALFSLFFGLAISHFNLCGQKIPKFCRTYSDTLLITDKLPAMVRISIGESDPSLIHIKSSDISNYMINRFNDSTFIVNTRGGIDETKLKLYYKNIPVDILPATFKSLEIPKVYIKDYDVFPAKSNFDKINSFICDIDENYKNKHGVTLHSFDIHIHFPDGRKEYLQNYSTNIIAHNLIKLKSLPSNTTVIFGNVKLRTIYNHIVDVPGESNKFQVKE